MKKNKKVSYSLFSFGNIIGIFVAAAISVIFTVIISIRTKEKITDTSSKFDEWLIATIAFLFLCFTYTVIILIYRKYAVKNPIMRILKATEKIGSGDFSVKLPVKNKKRFRNEYDVIFENINVLAQQLSGIETLRQDFVSNVSHEFKSPLSVIENSATILMKRELSEEDRLKYAKNVSDATKRLASMITNILKLNNLESQKIFTKKDKINLSEQLKEEILLFEQVWNEKNIDIDFNSEDSVIIMGDKELLSLMWSNLLSNAFKFTPENGSVCISISVDERYVYVSVKDTGEGIPEDKLQRIFEKFYQCDISHVTAGNGLGLALVKTIADIFGYEITVRSTVGTGSTFTVKLNK